MRHMDRERESHISAQVEAIGCDLPPEQRPAVRALARALLTLDETTRRLLAEAIEGRLAECRAARGGTHV